MLRWISPIYHNNHYRNLSNLTIKITQPRHESQIYQFETNKSGNKIPSNSLDFHAFLGRFFYKSGANLSANYIYGQIFKKLHNWVSHAFLG